MSNTLVTERPTEPAPDNPLLEYLRRDRMPHIWCPGCGIGTAVNCFIRALMEAKLPRDEVAVVSGIGCTGRVAGYLNLDTFHTTHGRAIPFATGLKLGNPKLKVVVFSGDGDLFSIGGNHFVHAARRNMDLFVICCNNFTYGMTGGQVAPTSPVGSASSTTPYGNFEPPMNLPFLADACGATWVARWTVFHIKQLTRSIREGLLRPGFRFLEILSPCPTLFLRRNRLGDGAAMVRHYKEKSVVRNGADTKTVDLAYHGEIPVGQFVTRERPSWLDAMNAHFTALLGERYRPYTGAADAGAN